MVPVIRNVRGFFIDIFKAKALYMKHHKSRITILPIAQILGKTVDNDNDDMVIISKCGNKNRV